MSPALRDVRSLLPLPLPTPWSTSIRRAFGDGAIVGLWSVRSEAYGLNTGSRSESGRLVRLVLVGDLRRDPQSCNFAELIF
ncbi:hypothetical protein OG936_01865 [Streptomyces sp. NBC_00846]|uniref:hypothetical protein n=1 Tax=Streptomyces sp. NBC_00846 TaxID=2975849 RepID=UPI003867BFCD|nr:hypothetical protein OG936_01865 [Streptomyces sp. NBC_00846]